MFAFGYDKYMKNVVLSIKYLWWYHVGIHARSRYSLNCSSAKEAQPLVKGRVGAAILLAVASNWLNQAASRCFTQSCGLFLQASSAASKLIKIPSASLALEVAHVITYHIECRNVNFLRLWGTWEEQSKKQLFDDFFGSMSMCEPLTYLFLFVVRVRCSDMRGSTVVVKEKENFLRRAHKCTERNVWNY